MKISEELAESLAEFFAEKYAPILTSYVKENVPKYLPDIDEVERDVIATSKFVAKSKVEDWRAYRSVSIALWEMVLREKDPEKRKLLSKMWDEVQKEAMKLLEDASSAKLRAETLEQYGLKMHSTNWLVYLIPLALLFILPRR